MEGLHLTADCFDCNCDSRLLLNQSLLQELLTNSTLNSGLTIVGDHYHAFQNPDGSAAGVTCALLLAESHVAVHTWPERRAVTLDVYVCNFNQDNSDKARFVVDQLTSAFQPAQVARQAFARGQQDALLALEHLTADTVYGTRLSEPLVQASSPYQQIEIAETRDFGRVMRIDGAMMTSEKDEFFYHECLVHPAAIAHTAPRNALVIGGGDGGACKELLRHPSLQQITLCEIDAEVVALARRHLCQIHGGALDDPRVEYQNGDGYAFVLDCQRQFDLILLDLTDPISPNGSTLAAPCLTPEFFAACNQRLSEHGMLVCHLGSPFYHAERFARTLQDLAAVFPVVRPYTVFIPLYGALWGMAVASRHSDPAALAASTVKQRVEHRGLQKLRYYNADLHHALFALPNFVRDLMPTSI